MPISDGYPEDELEDIEEDPVLTDPQVTVCAQCKSTTHAAQYSETRDLRSHAVFATTPVLGQSWKQIDC